VLESKLLISRILRTVLIGVCLVGHVVLSLRPKIARRLGLESVQPPCYFVLLIILILPVDSFSQTIQNLCDAIRK
jgi:hypothetical protein